MLDRTAQYTESSRNDIENSIVGNQSRMSPDCFVYHIDISSGISPLTPHPHHHSGIQVSSLVFFLPFAFARAYWSNDLTVWGLHTCGFYFPSEAGTKRERKKQFTHWRLRFRSIWTIQDTTTTPIRTPPPESDRSDSVHAICNPIWGQEKRG